MTESLPFDSIVHLPRVRCMAGQVYKLGYDSSCTLDRRAGARRPGSNVISEQRHLQKEANVRKWLVLAAAAVVLVIAACTLTADTTPPTVNIANPVGGDTLAKGSIVIKAVATDDKSVAKVEFYVDGALKGTDNVGGAGDTFRYTWADTSEQTSGAHTLGAKAYDNASTPNTTTSATVTVHIAGGGSGTGPTEHSGNIKADETWWPSGNPHILTSDVYVTDNATVTIKPGCVVKLDPGVEFYAGYGSPASIVAEGTADSVITFTSNVASPSPGDWQSIGIYDEAMNTASFKYCVFEYGGSDAQGEIFCRNHGVKFSHNVVRKSGSYGVNMQTIGFSSFDSNTITTCAEYPVKLEAEYIRTIGSGNVLTGNTHDAVYVDAGAVRQTGTWPNPGVPYTMSQDVAIGDNSNSPIITVTPGTVFKMFPNTEFYVGYGASGGLIADGTSGQIVFTSNSASPNPGDWVALEFYDNIITNQTKLVNCKVEYAGSGNEGANVLFRNCTPTVTGDSIGHSANYGIALWGSTHPDSTALEAANVFYETPSGHIIVH